MILFQEQMTVRDDTLDPAYFAKRPKRMASGAPGEGYDDTEIREIIKEQNIIINNLQTIVKNLQTTVNEWQDVHQSITHEEFEALSEEEKAKNVEYFIHD